MDWREIEHLLRLHGAKGGKTARRRQADRVRQLVEYCRQEGVRAPDQIGKAHIYRWYESLPGAAPSTLRDRYYAVRLLWEMLRRAGDPPRPTFASQREGGAAEGGGRAEGGAPSRC